MFEQSAEQIHSPSLVETLEIDESLFLTDTHKSFAKAYARNLRLTDGHLDTQNTTSLETAIRGTMDEYGEGESKFPFSSIFDALRTIDGHDDHSKFNPITIFSGVVSGNFIERVAKGEDNCLEYGLFIKLFSKLKYPNSVNIDLVPFKDSRKAGLGPNVHFGAVITELDTLVPEKDKSSISTSFKQEWARALAKKQGNLADALNFIYEEPNEKPRDRLSKAIKIYNNFLNLNPLPENEEERKNFLANKHIVIYGGAVVPFNLIYEHLKRTRVPKTKALPNQGS